MSGISGEHAKEVLEQIGWFDRTGCLITLHLEAQDMNDIAAAMLLGEAESAEQIVVRAIREFVERNRADGGVGHVA